MQKIRNERRIMLCMRHDFLQKNSLRMKKQDYVQTWWQALLSSYHAFWLIESIHSELSAQNVAWNISTSGFSAQIIRRRAWKMKMEAF